MRLFSRYGRHILRPMKLGGDTLMNGLNRFAAGLALMIAVSAPVLAQAPAGGAGGLHFHLK